MAENLLPDQEVSANAVLPPQPEPQPEANIIVQFGGENFQFEPTATPEFIQETLTNFKKTNQFDRLIDKSRESPFTIRALVDELESDEDKLATIKKYYPDADFYGEDNFVYTDPETGRFTLHNTEGFTAGDVAGYGRTASEAVFSGLGAAGALVAGQLGPQALAPEEIVTVPAAAAAGAEFGARAFDFFTGVFGGRQRTPKSLGGEFLESGVRMGAGATGEAIIGPAFVTGTKKLIGGADDAAGALVKKFKDLGIDPVAGAVSGSFFIGRMEAGLSQAAAAADTLYKQAERVIKQTSDAIDNITGKIGVAREKTAAGAAIKEAAESATVRTRKAFEKQYDDAFAEIGDDAMVDSMPSVRQALDPYLAEIARLPADAQPAGQVLSMVKKYKAIADMAESGQLSFKQFRKFRSDLLAIQRKKTAGTTGDFDKLVDDIADGMRADMSAAAQAANPSGAAKLAKADADYAKFKEGASKTLEKIKKYDADEKAFDYIMLSANSKGPEGVKALQRLREQFNDQEWGDVVASVFYNLGKEKSSAQAGQVAEFSVSTFMTRFAKLRESGPEVLDAMFKGTPFEDTSKELMNFVDVVSALKNVQRMSNTSNTAGAMHQLLTWQAIGGGSVGLMAGDVTGMAAGITGTVVAPWAGAKLLTSPGFVRWLSTPASEISKDISKHMTKLTALAADEPYLAEPIEQLVSAMRPATQYNQPENEAQK
jgi:hypothetical protein